MGKAVTGDGGAVAVGSKKRVDGALFSQIVIEKLIYNSADVFIYVSVIDKFLIVVSVVGDIVVIAFCCVPFCIDAI